MIKLNKIIQNALSKQDIPYYYVERPVGKFPSVVFYYNEYVKDRADNKIESLKYDCYFNLYAKSNLSANTNKIIKALEDAGFIKVVVNSPVKFDELDYYQITMNFVKRK